MSQHLDPASWLDEAQALKLGQSRRVAHDCGAGTPLTVWHKEDGWSAWCHRCALPGFVPRPSESLAEKAARLMRKREADDAAVGTQAPPMPAEFDPQQWPLAPQVWLYKAGISAARIKQAGIYWNERLQRVILPVIHEGRLVFWQGRSLDPDGIKYINPKGVDRDRIVYRAGQGDTLVLTEDILSAIRVGEVTEAWSVLGVRLPVPVLNEIVSARRRVLVWLDPDVAGLNGQADIVRQLRLVGVDAAAVQSRKDPKLYDKEDIVYAVGNLHTPDVEAPQVP